MSDAWRVASIKAFEQVPVATSSGLLRVSAQSAFRSRPDDLRPTLVADDGRTVSRFAAIPAPPDSGGVLRAAFSVPADVATPETVFSLEFEDGFVIALPDPTPGASRLNRRVTPAPSPPPAVAAPAPASVPPPSEPPSAPQPAAVEPPVIADPSAIAEPSAPVDASAAEGEDRRSDLQTKITELTGELAESRQQQAELRDAAEFGTRARDTILGMLSTAALAHAEVRATRDLSQHTAAATPAADDGARAELQQRLAETEQRLNEAMQLADSAANELADHRDRAQSLEDRAAAAESEARGHLDRLTDAERERDAAHEARRQAEAAVEPLMATRTRAEGEMAEVQDQLHKMVMERDELSRQAQAFDGVAVKARERAAEAEAELQRSSGRLSELEVWTAELERRLADATTELADARTTARADEAELRLPREQVGSGPPASLSPTGAVRTVGQTVRTVSDSRLDEMRRAAFSEAHAQAERDLEDASPTGRS